jgi:uncharacterized repeat protein (TIGR03806 family)
MKLPYLKTIVFTVFTMLYIVLFYSFKASNNEKNAHKTSDDIFSPSLSSYQLFDGELSKLIPAKGVELYELTSHLFVDYAEKQRLIKLPIGTKMTSNGNGLPNFPDGTILVKTFYWFKDKKNKKLGRSIIETRLLIKNNGKWKVGTYQWNSAQTEAMLITTGTNVNVGWKDSNGEERKILFHIPSNAECTNCHQYNNEDFPIGTKLRNMNFDVTRNNDKVNQLKYFQNIGWLDVVSTVAISTLPNWENTDFSLDKRARAYMDMNCAHCHNSRGSASYKKLFLDYETPYDLTTIAYKKTKILKLMESSNEELKMPKIGTSVIDIEGLELIKQYVKSIE